MKKNVFRKRHGLYIIFLLLMVILTGILVMTIRYPNRIKEMFIQSSMESLESKLNDAALYINDNVEMHYEEIKLLAGIISENLNGTDWYPRDVIKSMQETMKNAGYTNIGIVRLDSGRLFATMSTGRKVQLDAWVIAMDCNENEVSVELQTSPFSAFDSGEDAVVYRYIFKTKEGYRYMLIAEKPQDVLQNILNTSKDRDGLTMVFRDNGNVVYTYGVINDTKIKSYNVYAMLQEFGADDNKINEVRNSFAADDSGTFTMKVGEEPFYFMFHKIRHTNWICLYAYSETVMAGENLLKVNIETIKLVGFVVALLIAALILSVLVVINAVKKEGEQKALETEKLFEEMSRHIPNAFAILRERENEPRFVSYNFYEVIREDSFDFSLNGILKWLDEEFDEECDQNLRSGGRYEDTICKLDRYYSIGFYAIGKVNDHDHYVFIVNDITADVEAKKLLEDSMQRANATSESKTKFLSKMSHEIRTPLNSVIGFSRLALDEWKHLSNEELHDYMNKIQTSGNYLLELVSDTLDISKIEEGRLQITTTICNLDSMIDEIVDSFQGQMERKHHQFVIDKDYEDIVLNMDSFHTKQILNNLISNSCKYTDEGGVVGFEISVKKIDEKHVAVQYVIQDTGIGMSQEFVDVIFEPYTQEDRGMLMKQQLRGSGLGMPICKTLVDLQNGTIKVESELGEGSCFTVVIPYEIADEEQRQNKEKEAAKDYSCLKGKKILVVDDVEMNRIFIRKFMESMGILCDEAENGEQAVNMYEQAACGEYFAIFMDVNMPVMDGHKATEQIRKSEKKDAKSIVIVGMTADAFTDDISKALMSGMNYHVSKPVQIDRVKEILLETYEKEAGEINA